MTIVIINIMKVDLPAPLLRCFCGQTYSNPVDLEEHRRARGHFPSHPCTQVCDHFRVVKIVVKHNKCGTCGKLCASPDMLQDHHLATGHCYCSECQLHFETQTAFETHQNTVIHASEFKCCDCDVSFKDIHALDAHMAKKEHSKTASSGQNKVKAPKQKSSKSSTLAKNHACKDCLRKFKSAESLQQHRESVKHKPLSALKCPMGAKCRGKFAAPSALLHHLESGCCKSGINREKVYQLVQACDEDGMVHKRPALQPLPSPTLSALSSTRCSEAWKSCSSSDVESECAIFTPSVSEAGPNDTLEQWLLLDGIPKPITGSLSIEIQPTLTLKCHLCPKKRKFKNSWALQQHMNSAAHSPKVYHCPTNILPALPDKQGAKKNEKHFSTLGGLAQHLESGACSGGKRTFLQCVNVIQEKLLQVGMGGLRLLLPNA